MRRIQRLRKPATVLTQCLPSSPFTPLCRATASMSGSCLPSRPRDFSTTPNTTYHASRALAAESKGEGDPTIQSEVAATEPQPLATAPETQTLANTTVDLKEVTNKVANSTAYESPPPARVTPELSSIMAAASSPQPQRQLRSLATEPRKAVKLTLPPSERTTAPRPDELESNADYIPAHSAAELPVLGGLGTWFEKGKKAKRTGATDEQQQPPAPPAIDNFANAKHAFHGFAPSSKPVAEPALLELCVHRAVLEALAVRAAGPPELMTESWRADGGWDRALGLGVRVGEDGRGVEVVGEVREVVEWLLGDVGAREKMKKPAEAREILASVDDTWKEVSLVDAKLKFAVAKRILQLSGHAISDAKLLHVTNGRNLVATVIKPPPPSTVAQAIHRQGELKRLPNVTVHGSRQTPVDVARSLGRWKVVEQELVKRGLPVTGRDFEGGDKLRAREWYHGPRPAAKDIKKGRRKR